MKRFQKRVENFVCERCDTPVKGSGYTNHCPKCLWSKHVDINPGDRLAVCGGLMEPESIEGSSPNYKIIHRCNLCQHVSPNSVNPGDDKKAIVALAKKRARI